jgi:ABC-type multidrug transport system fused ATPase/permease subunit
LTGFQQLFAQLILVLITIMAILFFNAKLFLLLILVLTPPVILVFLIIRKKLWRIKKNIREHNERSYQYMLDALKGYVEANVFHRNDFFLQRFLNERRQFGTGLFQSLSLQNLPSREIEIFAIAGLFVLVLIAEWTNSANAGSLITIGAFLAAAYKIIPGIVKMVNLAGQIKAYGFSPEEFIAKMDSTEIFNAQENIHSVSLKDVYFNYSDKTIIQNVSADLTSGDFLGIRGESGIGKTTLINLLLGFLEPASGHILINNKSTDANTRKEYWSRIAYSRQQSFFLYDTVERNVTLQEQAADPTRMKIALGLSGLDQVIEKWPEGMQKTITENGKNISGGQQQRIALARVFYKDADLIILDEPLNELDRFSSTNILKGLQQLADEGKIIIMITHDTNSLAYCNKTLSIG